jgi:hypothetical protein
MQAGLVGSIVVSVLAGASLVCTQRVPAAGTHPVNVRFPTVDSDSSRAAVQPGAIRLDGNALIQIRRLDHGSKGRADPERRAVAGLDLRDACRHFGD